MMDESEAVVGNIENAPKRFLVETLGGVAIFGIIAVAAVLLSFFVSYLDSKGVDKVIIYGLRGAEYALFFVDLVLFVRFLWVTFTNTWRQLK